MSKLRTLYGFDVDVEEVAHLLNVSVLTTERGWATLLEKLRNLNTDEYNLYLHAIVVSRVEASHFAARGLANRVDYLDLSLTINEKMRRIIHAIEKPRMQFLNHLADDPNLGPDAKHVHCEFSQFRIAARIPASFFVNQQTFRLYAFTYVWHHIPQRDRKLTVLVIPAATSSYQKKLRREFGDPTKIPTTLRRPVTLEALRPSAAAKGASDSDTSSADTIERVDIAIITVIPEEYQAVKGLLSACTYYQKSRVTNRYSWSIGHVNWLGGGDNYRIVLAMSGRGAQTPASNCVSATIRQFRPRYVLLVGIAGGFHREGLQKGDVVLSQNIFAYQYGAMRGGIFQPRHDYEYRPDDALWTSALSVSADWSKGLTPPSGRDRVRSIPGNVASGDILVDDRSPAFWREVETAWERLLAVEMEGAAAAHAVEAARAEQLVGFLMVRGISDMPPDANVAQTGLASQEPSQQEAERAKWKTFASNSAASFAIHWIRTQWPVPPQSAASSA